jgi:hypothetical protein
VEDDDDPPLSIQYETTLDSSAIRSQWHIPDSRICQITVHRKFVRSRRKVYWYPSKTIWFFASDAPIFGVSPEKCGFFRPEPPKTPKIMICNDPMLQGASGKVGDKVYRQYNGRTFVSKLPRKPDISKRTAAQHGTTGNFTKASQVAKDLARNPLLRPGYIAMAKELNLPNAYTAAQTEQMQMANGQ